MSNRPTLEDVAREAGCSRSTVSYVILRTKPISLEVSERVKAAIAKLGYRPYRARCSKAADKIALLSGNMFSLKLLQIFSEELQKRGLLCLPVSLPGTEPLDHNGMAILAGLNNDSGIAGIINIHPHIAALDLLSRCKNKPCVIYNREGSMLSRCHLNVENIGIRAAQRCQQLGFKEIGVLLDDFKHASQIYLKEIRVYFRSANPAAEITAHFSDLSSLMRLIYSLVRDFESPVA